MSDPWKDPVAAPPASAAKKPSKVVWTGVVLMVVGLVVGTFTVVKFALPFTDVINAPTMETPGTHAFALQTGRQAVYERSSSGGTFGQPEGVDLEVSDIKVTSPSGSAVRLKSPNSGDTFAQGAESYVSVATFDADVAGDYQVAVTSRTSGRVLVAPSLTATAEGVLGWILGAVIAGGVFLIGVIVFIVGLVRRSRRSRSAMAPPFGGGYGPAPGAYGQNPGGYGQGSGGYGQNPGAYGQGPGGHGQGPGAYPTGPAGAGPTAPPQDRPPAAPPRDPWKA